MSIRTKCDKCDQRFAAELIPDQQRATAESTERIPGENSQVLVIFALLALLIGGPFASEGLGKRVAQKEIVDFYNYRRKNLEDAIRSREESKQTWKDGIEKFLEFNRKLEEENARLRRE